MLTAYDYPTAHLLAEAGIPMLLVGDWLGQAMLGYEIDGPGHDGRDDPPHARRSSAAPTGLVVGDMPFLSYSSPDEALDNAGRFLREAGAHAVKIEGGVRSARIVEALVKAGIPVMGHIGLTPQSINAMAARSGSRARAGRGRGRCSAMRWRSRRPAPSPSSSSSSRSSSRRPSATGSASRRSASAPVPAAAARSRSSPICSAWATSSRATPSRTPTCGARSWPRREPMPTTSRPARSRVRTNRSGWTRPSWARCSVSRAWIARPRRHPVRRDPARPRPAEIPLD